MEDKTFELMEKMYSLMQEGFKDIRGEMQEGFKDIRGEMQEGFKDIRGEMQEGFKDVRAEIKEVKERVINIENDHGKKLTILFDGQLQNTQQLDRIEKEVSKHEDFILKRVK